MYNHNMAIYVTVNVLYTIQVDENMYALRTIHICYR
jgi:hypothetical protein